MSKLIKWFWGKGQNKPNSHTDKPPDFVANESDELESESEEESKQNSNNTPLDESLKIVEEIKKKREEEEKLKEEEEDDEEEEPEKFIADETLASLSKDYCGYSVCGAEEIFDKARKYT